MNTPLITMTKAAAKEKLRAYKRRLGSLKGKAVAKEVQEQYESVMAGYRALAKGTPLIDLEEALRACGFDHKGRPHLAICRADKKFVRFDWRDSSSGVFRPDNSYRSNDQIVVNFEKRPEEAISSRRDGWINTYDGGHARVPIVPADVRPEYGNEKDWFILWEVEKWADKRSELQPDRDPYLLKHLGGSLYAVIAEWDLTDLERAVMKQQVIS